MIYLDTETTGLNDGLKLDEAVQIAITNEQLEDVFCTLLNPTVAIDEQAQATHGYDKSKLQNAPRFADVIKFFAPHLQGQTVAIYNAAYDVRILLNTAHNAGVLLPKIEAVCIMQMYSERWCANAFNVKLTAALEQQGLQSAIDANAHDALVDAKMTAVLHRHLQSGDVQTMQTRGAYNVQLVSVQKRLDRNAKPYLAFATVGGQTVNIFASNFALLESKGYPLTGWMQKLEEGKVQPLSVPIDATIAHDAKGYCNLQAVNSEYAHANGAKQND